MTGILKQFCMTDTSRKTLPSIQKHHIAQAIANKRDLQLQAMAAEVVAETMAKGVFSFTF